MKVTRLGRTRPLVSLSGILAGGDYGPPGQVPTSIGSNGAISWGSNVSVITANGSNALLGPYVNFQSGTGVTFSVASNTLTIASSGSGGSSNAELNIEGGQSVIHAHGSMGATETIDPTLGNVHTGTLNADLTLTLSAPVGTGAAALELWFTQDGTGGWDITWPGSVTVNGTPDTTAGTTSVWILESLDGGSSWVAFLVGGGSSVGALDDLSDVTITTPAEGDRLRYDGSEWTNSPLFWRLVTTYDGTNWLPAVDGDGNAIYTEA